MMSSRYFREAMTVLAALYVSIMALAAALSTTGVMASVTA
jgi:hypothetical protein